VVTDTSHPCLWDEKDLSVFFFFGGGVLHCECHDRRHIIGNRSFARPPLSERLGQAKSSWNANLILKENTIGLFFLFFRLRRPFWGKQLSIDSQEWNPYDVLTPCKAISKGLVSGNAFCAWADFAKLFQRSSGTRVKLKGKMSVRLGNSGIDRILHCHVLVLFASFEDKDSKDRSIESELIDCLKLS